MIDWLIDWDWRAGRIVWGEGRAGGGGGGGGRGGEGGEGGKGGGGGVDFENRIR